MDLPAITMFEPAQIAAYKKSLKVVHQTLPKDIEQMTSHTIVGQFIT